MNDWLVVNSTQTWMKGIIFQGNRLLSLTEDMIPSDEPNAFFKWAETSRENHFIRQIEEHFFVIATNKAIAWLLEAEKLSLIDRSASKEFRKSAKLGTQVRNMREHDIKYFQGQGKKQDSFEAEVNINGIEGAGSADASSTIITDDGYLIGGRVNVEQVMKKSRNFITYN